jgi:CRISPR/Cas system-associated protein endoribonuclease Cas2
MSAHFQNVLLAPSFRERVIELVEPIESVQSAIEGESPVPHGLELLTGELTMVILIFTNADRKITDEETTLLNDFRRTICGDNAFVLPSRAYSDLCRKFLSLHPHRRLSIDHKPRSIRYLHVYDQQYATEYAEKARALFLELAESITQADGTESSQEMITFLNFKEILYSPEPSLEPGE